jgi:hypothetical protein
MDKHRDIMIAYGGRSLSLLTLPPIMTGSSGKTHGAKIVRSPDTKAMMSNESDI